MTDKKVRNVTDLVKMMTADKKSVKHMSKSEIVKLLTKLSSAYHDKGTPLIDDITYDYIRDYLEEIDDEHPFLYQIGAPLKGTKNKAKLPFQMGSLKKIKPPENNDKTDTLKNWISNFSGPFFFSDKLDGASAQLWKDHNGNIMLYSRGDGTEGQDISNLTSLIFDKNTLNKIPNGTSIRGELIISIKNFNNVSDYMKNARNAVAGLVNSKTVDNKIAKNTDFVAYSILSPRFKYSEQMKKLESWKINTVKHKKVNTLSHNILSSYLTERKSKSLYEIDGIVCIDDSVLYEHKGGFPEHAFAYKMITADQMKDFVDLFK